LALGAAGVAMGTRFLASQECAAHPEYKQRVVAAGANETVYNTLFDLEWPDAPLRSLRNATLDAWEHAGRPARGARPGEGETIGALRRGDLSLPVPRYSAVCPTIDFQGAVAETALYAGQSCELVRDIRPAAAIVADIVREAEEALQRALGGGH